MLVGGNPGTGSLTHQAHDLTKLGWLLLLLILLVVLLEGSWGCWRGHYEAVLDTVWFTGTVWVC